MISPTQNAVLAGRDLDLQLDIWTKYVHYAKELGYTLKEARDAAEIQMDKLGFWYFEGAEKAILAERASIARGGLDADEEND